MTEISIRKAGKPDLQAIQRLLSTYFLDIEGLKAEDFVLAEINGQIRGCAALVKSEFKGKKVSGNSFNCGPSEFSGKRDRNKAC